MSQAPAFPAELTPTDHLRLTPVGSTLSVPVCRPVFPPAQDVAGVHTWGGKALLQVDQRAQFAEVAILRAFENDGWQGRWVETYGKPNKAPGLWRDWNPAGPAAQAQHPIEDAWMNDRLVHIAAANANSFGGCWDVVAWKNDRLVFAEAKLSKEDRMRPTQLHWVEAALNCGMGVEDFLVVEWTPQP